MSYLKLFTSLLKVMRVFFILMLFYVVFGLVVELFFPSADIHTVFSHDDPTKYDDSYFSKTTWIIITSLSAALITICLIQTCSFLIRTMKNFKHQEYFIVENAMNFKSSGIYFLIALFITPLIINILHGVDYLISSSDAESVVEKQFPDWFIKMIPFISEKIPGLIMWMVVGLFLYVMGEVIQKAVDVKEENDLTI